MFEVDIMEGPSLYNCEIADCKCQHYVRDEDERKPLCLCGHMINYHSLIYRVNAGPGQGQAINKIQTYPIAPNVSTNSDSSSSIIPPVATSAPPRLREPLAFQIPVSPSTSTTSLGGGNSLIMNNANHNNTSQSTTINNNNSSGKSNHTEGSRAATQLTQDRNRDLEDLSSLYSVSNSPTRTHQQSQQLTLPPDRDNYNINNLHKNNSHGSINNGSSNDVPSAPINTPTGNASSDIWGLGGGGMDHRTLPWNVNLDMGTGHMITSLAENLLHFPSELSNMSLLQTQQFTTTNNTNSTINKVNGATLPSDEINLAGTQHQLLLLQQQYNQQQQYLQQQEEVISLNQRHQLNNCKTTAQSAVMQSATPATYAPVPVPAAESVPTPLRVTISREPAGWKEVVSRAATEVPSLVYTAAQTPSNFISTTNGNQSADNQSVHSGSHTASETAIEKDSNKEREHWCVHARYCAQFPTCGRIHFPDDETYLKQNGKKQVHHVVNCTYGASCSKGKFCTFLHPGEPKLCLTCDSRPPKEHAWGQCPRLKQTGATRK